MVGETLWEPWVSEKQMLMQMILVVATLRLVMKKAMVRSMVLPFGFLLD